MSAKVYIIGAGGHTRSVISLLKDQNYEILGIYDDTYEVGKAEIINSIEVIGTIADYKRQNNIILSIGDNFKRQNLFEKFQDSVFMENISHSLSFIESSSKLENANLIFGNVFINSNVKIGTNNIINTGAIIEHEVMIGSHNHISVGSIICGRSSIGNNCFLGAGSVINDSISICDRVLVASNSTVIHSIKEPGIYAGQPAKKVK